MIEIKKGSVYEIDVSGDGHKRVVKVRNLCLECDCVRIVYSRTGGSDDVYDLDHFKEIIIREIVDRKPGDYAF